MKCKKCDKEISDDSIFCSFCGKKQITASLPRKPKVRGNGQGTVYKLPNNKWRAEITLGYKEDGTRIPKVKGGFKTKKDALEYLPTLRGTPKEPKKINFKSLYDKWHPTHRAGKSTLDGYKFAMKYFEPLWYVNILDIDIDDLQECVDDCPKESVLGKI